MAVSNGRFLDVVRESNGIDLRNSLNEVQYTAVSHEDDRILQIVAGPGSGKTTVLILRALWFVFVHGILPENILVTTFTRKAARELRTRWLDWGTALFEILEAEMSPDCNKIDLNRCRIDTLDSVIQQAMSEYRIPTELPPVVAEKSASNLMFKRSIFSTVYRSNKDLLDRFLKRYTNDQTPPRNQGEALRVTKQLIDRLIQDRVDLESYACTGFAQNLVVEMLKTHRRQAIETNVYDFTFLEESFLRRQLDGSLSEWSNTISVLLVDEYQDTNPIQESIYFTLIEQVNPSMTIVGDDDQSMYRFRGGSVELFTGFAERCYRNTGCQTRRVDMMRNFRSRPEIISFYNGHITSDPDFGPARISPSKPAVERMRDSEDIPVIGMFRPDPETLAEDIVGFINDLISQRSVPIGCSGHEIRMTQEGDLGDIVYLAHSIQEISYDYRNRTPKFQFPGLLRSAMHGSDLEVFNPRGQALRNLHSVSVLLGLTLLAVDAENDIIEDVMPTNEAAYFLRSWKQIAQSYIDQNPPPNDDRGLCGFIEDWQNAGLGRVSESFTQQDWPVLEIIFKLVSWIPGFQREPEHQVWLEAIARSITSASIASPFGMRLLQNTKFKHQGDLVRLSRISFVRDALLPIAENEVEVDEEIVPSIPRDRLQLMTVHQAKGLEFPLVLVDVGSRFKIDSPKQRFLRFPEEDSNVARIEDDVEPHLDAPLRGHRDALDRTIDDLVRLYYVAFSRAQSVLMLVGCENCLRYGTGPHHTNRVIPNVALGWHRNHTWPWRQAYSGRKPPVRVNPPFVLI